MRGQSINLIGKCANVFGLEKNCDRLLKIEGGIQPSVVLINDLNT